MLDRRRTASSIQSFSSESSFSSDSSLLPTPASSIAGDTAEWMNLDDTQLWDPTNAIQNRFDCTLSWEPDPMSAMTYEMQCAYDKMNLVSSASNMNRISEQSISNVDPCTVFSTQALQQLVAPRDLSIDHSISPSHTTTTGYTSLPLRCIKPQDTTYLEPCDLISPSHAPPTIEYDWDSEGSLLYFDGLSDCTIKPWTSPSTPTNNTPALSRIQKHARIENNKHYRQLAPERMPPPKPPQPIKIITPEEAIAREWSNQQNRRRRNQKLKVAVSPNFPCDVRRRGERRCNFCSRYFERKEHLKRHEKSHTVTFDQKQPCKFCGKRFDRLDNLRAHVVLHTQKKKSSRTNYFPEAWAYWQALRQKSAQGRRAAAGKRVKVEPAY